MIPASIIIVGLWAAFEHSGNTNLGLAKGINVGIYLTVYGYAAIMNTFGTTVSDRQSQTSFEPRLTPAISTPLKSCLPRSELPGSPVDILSSMLWVYL